MVNLVSKSNSCSSLDRLSFVGWQETNGFAASVTSVGSSDSSPTPPSSTRTSSIGEYSGSSAKQEIAISINSRWVNPETRAECKYSPITVDKGQSHEVNNYMKSVMQKRIDLCMDMARNSNDELPCHGLSFQVSDVGLRTAGMGHSFATVPAVVISGGSAEKIKAELSQDIFSKIDRSDSLDGRKATLLEVLDSRVAWHPDNMKGEPVYLLVHKDDFDNYKSVLSDELKSFSNLYLASWDGGELTGFGAARVAAAAFADSLGYKPERFMMIDQDVVATPDTHPASKAVQKDVVEMHKNTGQPIVGLGSGKPTRFSMEQISQAKENQINHSDKSVADVPMSREGVGKSRKNKNKVNVSPVQQFVSIQTKHAEVDNKLLYPAFMVAGGEDMFMGQSMGLVDRKKGNMSLRTADIYKKELKGEKDAINTYWDESRVQTLEKLYENEKGTLLNFGGETMTLEGLMNHFLDSEYIKKAEIPNTAACVIERIMLIANRL
ncbi:hypothetical protein [Chromobacterium vaccinii]|uniref:hypothetical protein n=1 Tax=Chromobacterium vaccinii TaxID=1108595 RepID=UPI001E504CAB|nr:hypothetical protein [Chromobacterium vaccinii]MCD4501694.1 hypothetical protein [Chromobacterium vaccinii]